MGGGASRVHPSDPYGTTPMVAPGIQQGSSAQQRKRNNVFRRKEHVFYDSAEANRSCLGTSPALGPRSLSSTTKPHIIITMLIPHDLHHCRLHQIQLPMSDVVQGKCSAFLIDATQF